MIDLEVSEYALHPLSGVAEAWHAAGVASGVADADAANPDESGRDSDG